RAAAGHPDGPRLFADDRHPCVVLFEGIPGPGAVPDCYRDRRRRRLMRISPLDIRQQQFSVRWFRGFDVHEVDTFLDDVAEDYETVLKENAQLKEQVSTFEERSRGLSERERALQDTLVTTHRLGDEMKATARREADLQVREAELRSEKIIEEGRAEEARIRSEIQTLRRVRRQLIEDFRATLESYYRMMSVEFGEDKDDGKG